MRVLLLAVGMLGISGCASDRPEDMPPMVLRSPNRLKLEDYVGGVSTRIDRAADDIIQNSSSPEASRNAVFWKLRVVPSCRRALALADDQAAYVELWLTASSMRYFFSEGEGKDFFGDATDIAATTSEAIEHAIERLGPVFLKPEQIEKLSTRIDEYAKQLIFTETDKSAPGAVSALGGAMSEVLGKPLSLLERPLSAINPGAGISDTAAAVHRIASTAEQARTDLEFLPAQLRGETQLLMLEMQENPVVAQALASFAEVSETSAAVAQTAATLPQDVGDQVSRILSEVDGKQAGIQGTLREANTAIDGVDKALGQADTVLTTADKTAEQLTIMSEAYSRLLASVDAFLKQFEPPPGAEPEPPVPPDERPPPFDINDYRRTAEELTQTAHALTGTLQEVRAITAPEATSALLSETEATLKATVNHLLVRAALLVLFTFLAALAYRLIVLRLKAS